MMCLTKGPYSRKVTWSGNRGMSFVLTSGKERRGRGANDLGVDSRVVVGADF